MIAMVLARCLAIGAIQPDSPPVVNVIGGPNLAETVSIWGNLCARAVDERWTMV
jgi:hypothetical protein